VLIGCRLTAEQKAEMVRLLKEYNPKRVVMAVGDGLNDICMMKEADVSVCVGDNPVLTQS
jgi:P-type E1-E2 ATPase